MNQNTYTILIVDDSDADRELYRRYLLKDKKHDYRIVEAKSGQEGLKRWDCDQPHAVLLDYNLPDLDGLEFLAEIQNQSQLPCLPVIMVTGQGNEMIAVQAMKAGSQDYLVKGQITPELLHLTVDRAIKNLLLHKQLQQRIELEQVVANITRQIHQSIDLNEILNTTVTEVRGFLRSDRVIILHLESDSNGTVIAESVGEKWPAMLSIQIDQPCVEDGYCNLCAKTDIDDGSLSSSHLELLAQFQVKSHLVVPILQNNQLWGMLIAHHCESSRQWQDLEIDLLEQLANQLGIACRQAELYQQTENELAERRQTEAILRDQEEHLRIALEAARMGTWDWNILTGQIKWSANMESLFGLAQGEFDGSFAQFESCLHPEDRERVLEAIDHAVTAGANYNIEFRVVYPNGRIRWAQSQGKVFYDSTGQPVRMAGVDIDITERKQAEKALREQATWLTVAQQATRSGLWFWNISSGYAKVSEAYCHLHGIPITQEISYQDWLNLIYPEDRDWIGDYVRRIFEKQEDYYEVEYRIVRSDGFYWLSSKAQVFYDPAGNPLKMTGNVQDITERKRAEEALRESEYRYATLTEAAPVAIFRFDAAGNCIYVNNHWCEMTGRPAEMALGKRWTETLHPDDSDRLLRQWEQWFQGSDKSEFYQNEGRILRLDGSTRWFYCQVLPETNLHNEIIGYIGTLTDITKRKQAEKALQQSEARYRLLADTVPNIVWIADSAGVTEYVNERWSTYTGLTFQDGIEMNWTQAIHPEDVPQVEEAWQSILNQETSTYKIEYRLKCADGTYRWNLVRGHSLEDEDSRCVKWFGTCTDIHEQVEFQAERDRLLAQERAARTEAERANRIKDEFLAILSHELRSPLNPILGYTQLLQSHKLDQATTAEALATIERNAKLQTQLIDDLLDIARILRGKMTLKATPVNLAFVIELAIETVRTAAAAKSILIHPVLPNIGKMNGDPVRLQQIVWNLLSNAIKFTPREGRINIILERSGQEALLSVTDTGKGISPDFLPYLFDYFRQEDASITRKQGGLGLGLAIVRHLVELHGGTVSATSPGLGQGATFTVRLPLLEMESKIDEEPQILPDQYDLTGVRLLTVDDDPDTREMLSLFLEQYGAQVKQVGSAAEALSTLKSFRPDVLISDIGMPDLDGYTLLTLIRSFSEEQGGQTPAIALTAYAREEDSKKALEVGFQGHLSKPVNLNKLMVMIVKLLN